MMKKHVAVLMGGMSQEREVSETSGRAVVKALNNLGYKVTEVDPGQDLSTKLAAIKPDVVFNALHGTYGEDGAIPGVLEILGIPYTHSGVMSSAIGMNKYITRKMLECQGVRFPEGMLLSVEKLKEMCRQGKDPMPRPYVIKPVSQGSTVGVYIIKDGDQNFLEQQDKHPWDYGLDALIERYIPGKEISTVVVNNKAIGSLELRPQSGFYDYEAKYTDGKTEHIYPAEIPADAYKEALHFAEVAHNTLCCRTLSRSDLRYDPEEGQLYFLEINTHPGFTDLSIVPEVAGYNGMSFQDIVQMLIDQATLDLKK